MTELKVPESAVQSFVRAIDGAKISALVELHTRCGHACRQFTLQQ